MILAGRCCDDTAALLLTPSVTAHRAGVHCVRQPSDNTGLTVGERRAVMEYGDGLRLVCDPKSLLYLFGMNLDYSDALVGGGFQFQNPNAEDTCGCGKSFGV